MYSTTRMESNGAQGRKQVKSALVRGDGPFPNNDRLPLLLYDGVFAGGETHTGEKSPAHRAVQSQAGRPSDPGRSRPRPASLASAIEDRFRAHGWGNSWRDGVYGTHHYHSEAHEALGVYAGRARVQFGGERGPVFEVRAGDALVIPAGVAHKRLDSSGDFGVVGAYPPGQSPDMCYGVKGERPASDERIARVSGPQTDPVFGGDGPLLELWGG